MVSGHLFNVTLTFSDLRRIATDLLPLAMTRVEINRLHPADHRLWSAVESATWTLARVSRRRLDLVCPTSKKEGRRAYGFCHVADSGFRCIELSLRTWEKNQKWGRREPAYIYLQTIAHEVAHLGFSDHSPRWFAEFIRLLNVSVELNLLVDIQRCMD